LTADFLLIFETWKIKNLLIITNRVKYRNDGALNLHEGSGGKLSARHHILVVGQLIMGRPRILLNGEYIFLRIFSFRMGKN